MAPALQSSPHLPARKTDTRRRRMYPPDRSQGCGVGKRLMGVVLLPDTRFAAGDVFTREPRGLTPRGRCWSQAIGRAADAERPSIEDVQVHHRRRDVRVPEQFLHGADVVAVFKQMRRE